MIKPRALKFGDTIGVIAPAGPANKENIENARKNLEALGFKVKMGSACYKKYGYLAGTDAERAADLNAMFKDRNVAGIICLRGGYGAARILDKINYTLVRDNAKVFVGYSDITALHIAFNIKCKLITFHGPMLYSDMSEELDEFSIKSLLRAVMKQESLNNIENPIGQEIKCLIKGKAEGQLIGGNLSIIVSGLGTPYEIETKGKILFLEDIGEEPYRVDRMLTQLALAGKLRGAAGFILGDWNHCEPKDSSQSLTLLQVFKNRLEPLKKPTLYNIQGGHCIPKITLPFGVKVFLDSDSGKLKVGEGVVD